MKIQIIDKNGKKGEGKTVDSAIFGTKLNKALITQSIRIYLSNQRSAKAKVKTRAEITGSNAKIWRQKGTGRARHGNRKAPIFVGGGVSFGPTGRENYKLKSNQKAGNLALFSIIGDKLEQKRLFLFDDLKFQKTKEAFMFLEKVKETLEAKGRMGILVNTKDIFVKYLKNIREVEVLNTNSLNPYLIANLDYIFLTPLALKDLEIKHSTKKKTNDKQA